MNFAQYIYSTLTFGKSETPATAPAPPPPSPATAPAPPPPSPATAPAPPPPSPATAPVDPPSTEPTQEVSSYAHRPLFKQPITFRPKYNLDQTNKLCRILSYHMGDYTDMKEWIDDIKKQEKKKQKKSYQEVIICLAESLYEPVGILYPRHDSLKNILYKMYHFEINKIKNITTMKIHKLRRGKRGYQMKDTREMTAKEFKKKIALLNLL